ncbi:DUF6634 family protein [Breoghania sp.]|uniref:DUF6634 family protein n=1 Tax=Breoghania sp. TaxID=2065378 RepID=UPI002AA6E8C3|nr:DUF6634 family protein [Breoghania sp.]
MIRLTFAKGLQVDRTHEEIRKLRSLADDLESILRGLAPTRASLEAAPLLEGHRLFARPVPALLGRVSGHPLLGEAPRCRTSELWAHAPDHGWARTYSRWYRLSVPDRREVPEINPDVEWDG